MRSSDAAPRAPRRWAKGRTVSPDNCASHYFTDPAHPLLDRLRPPLELSRHGCPPLLLPGLTDPALLEIDRTPLPRRLSRCLPAWRLLLEGSPHQSFILSGISNGFRIPGTETLDSTRRFRRFNSASARAHAGFVTEEIDKLIRRGVLAPISEQKALGVMSIAVARQACGKLRLVVDGTPLNRLCPEPDKFAYEDLAFVSENMPDGAWLTKFDTASLYFHLPLHRQSVPWCCIYWEGRYLAFKAWPLGVAPAPRLATLVLRPAVALLRSLDIGLAQYLDDGLVWAQSEDKALTAAQLYVHLLFRLGFLVHPDKSVVQPTQTIEFLGFSISTAHPGPPVASITQRRRAAIRACAKNMRTAARRGTVIPVRRLASLVGLVVSTAAAFEPALPMLNRLHRFIAEVTNSRSWSAWVQLPADFQHEFRAIKSMMVSELWTSRPLRPPPTPDAVITTDASAWGWAAYMSSPADPDVPTSPTHQARWPEVPSDRSLLHLSFTTLFNHLSSLPLALLPDYDMGRAAAILDQLYQPQPSPGLSGQLHNNILELEALLLALLFFAPQIASKNIVLRSDNIAALAAIRRGTSPSPHLSRLALQTRFVLSCLRTPVVAATHLPGVDNIEADDSSRRWLPRYGRLEWPVDRQLLTSILGQHHLPLPELDAFATAANSVASKFWSLRPDPRAEACDAFAQLWSGRSLFINPPFALAARVVAKIIEEPPTYALLLLPDWPAAPWFRLLSGFRSVLLPPEVVASGPGHNLPEPLVNPAWRIRLWAIGSPQASH